MIGSCGGDLQDGATRVTLEVVSGTVEVQQGPGAGFVIASDGEVLAEGSVVRTGPDGRAVIEWFDGSVTRLDFDSTFRITELQSARPIGATRIGAEQTEGSSYHRVIELTQSGSRFTVDTPTASAAVEGTVFAVLTGPDGSSTVVVKDGTVVVTTASGEPVAVTAGSMVIVDAAGNVTGPVPISDDILNSPWIEFNEGCDAGACAGGGPGGEPLAISPADATINLGESQAYTAEAFDAHGASLGPVEATYDIDGVPCDGSVCTPTAPGDYTVTGRHAGLSATASLTVLATGDIQVTLDWSAAVDLDLRVTDPNGETISYLSRTSSSGGRLDRDAYAACIFTDPPPENTVWDGTAPPGGYVVTVDAYDMCGQSAVSFTLTVRIAGQVVLVVDDVVLTTSGQTHQVSFEKG